MGTFQNFQYEDQKKSLERRKRTKGSLVNLPSGWSSRPSPEVSRCLEAKRYVRHEALRGCSTSNKSGESTVEGAAIPLGLSDQYSSKRMNRRCFEKLNGLVRVSYFTYIWNIRQLPFLVLAQERRSIMLEEGEVDSSFRGCSLVILFKWTERERADLGPLFSGRCGSQASKRQRLSWSWQDCLLSTSEGTVSTQNVAW